jgi:hypothetical protein
VHLVQQGGLQVLPDDVRSALDQDVLVAGGGTGQLECSLDPIRHEGVGRTALHGQGLSRFVSHDEHRHVERWRVAPRLEADVEHPLPYQDRPVRGIDLIQDRGVGLRLRVESPVVEPIPTVPHPITDAHVRSGDEPIKRHRYL